MEDDQKRDGKKSRRTRQKMTKMKAQNQQIKLELNFQRKQVEELEGELDDLRKELRHYRSIQSEIEVRQPTLVEQKAEQLQTEVFLLHEQLKALRENLVQEVLFSPSLDLFLLIPDFCFILILFCDFKVFF